MLTHFLRFRISCAIQQKTDPRVKRGPADYEGEIVCELLFNYLEFILLRKCVDFVLDI